MSRNITIAVTCLVALFFALAAVACGDEGGENGDDPILVPDASTPLADASLLDPDDGGTDLADGSLAPDSGETGDGAAVEWCQVVSPQSADLRVGETLTAYAQVYAIGRTEGAYRQDSGVRGQLGVGSAGSDPRAATSDWTWQDASYNANFSDQSGNHDEYMADHLARAAGTYAYAFRFQVDGGDWFYCDSDGHSASNDGEGFSIDALGRLTVTEAGSYRVGWCNLQNTSRTISTLGKHLVTSQIYVEGLTENGNAGSALIAAQLGHGSADTELSAWTWTDAVVNAKADTETLGNNNEYLGELTGLAAGRHAFAFRYRASGDDDWFYCDSDGHSASNDGEGFSADMLGTITVLDPATLTIGWCQLQGPSPIEIGTGEGFTAYGQVFVEGLTGESNGYLEDPSIVAQLGVVTPQSSLADLGNAPEVWMDARVNATPASPLGNNSEYMATFPGLASGTYSFAYRFRIEGQESWRYCDLDPDTAAFQVEQQGQLVVK